MGTAQRDAIEGYAERLVNESLACIREDLGQCDVHSRSEIEEYVGGIVKESMERCLAEWRQRRILCVGKVCLDIITVVDEYPVEDSKTPAVEVYYSRGGNASNSSTVLASLGANVEFLGIIVLNKDAQFLMDDFRALGVNIEHCALLDPGTHKAPSCPVIVSRKTGSRTALPDFKNVARFSFSDFDKLDLDVYGWIHFEGSRVSKDIEQMLSKMTRYNENKSMCERVITSVEIEQPASVSPELMGLFDKADYVFVSKDFAMDDGLTSMEKAVEGLVTRCRAGATVICAWGESGAAAKRREGPPVVSPSFPPEAIVDTIGAGDTFNAATIMALSQGRSLQDAVTFGCRVAGAKCGMKGYSGLKGMF